MSEEEKKFPADNLIQRCVDLETGRDITEEVISRRLQELEVLASALIQAAVANYRANSSNQRDIYESCYWDLHQKLGQGSIGPATAAAGPLMYSKMEELAKLLEIDEKDWL